MQQATRVVPLLLQTIERASKQTGQLALVTEVVSASCTLVRLASVDIEAGEGLLFFVFLIDVPLQVMQVAKTKNIRHQNE